MHALQTLFLISTAAYADHPPGAVLESAVALDISEQGLDAFVPIVDGFIPSSIEVPPFSDAVCEEQCLPWPLDSTCFCWYEYDYSITNGSAVITLDNADITPGNGELLLDADLTISLNSAADPIDVHLFGEIVELISISEDCDAWVEPFQVHVTGSIGLVIDPVTGELDATVPPLDWAWTLTGDDFQLTNCGTVSTLTDFLDFFGIDIFGLILDFVEPEVASAIEGLTSELEQPIEDAFAGLSISDEFDLGGVLLSVDIAPTQIDITPAGVRLHLDGSIDGPADPCVAQYGITESLATPSTLDPLGFTPPGSPFTPDLSIYADDDLVNQALFAVWNGGLLCQTIDDDFEGLPLPIDTSLLGLIAPGVYDDLFVDIAPMSLVIKPMKPPIGSTVGAHDLNIDIENLGLAFYGEFEGREIRILEMDLRALAGVDLNFDGSTGALGVDVAFGGDDLTATVAYNELTADSNAQLEGAVVSLFDSLAGPLLGGLLTDLAFDLPSFEGFGLQEVYIAPAGSAGDRLGVFGALGPVGYQGASCDGSGGCVGSGCDGGCTSGSAPGPLFLLAFPLVLGILRRRG